MVSDVRAQQAREHHRAYAEAQGDAERHREQRNRLIRQLRESDPKRWTYAALAAAVGCGESLVRAIVNGRT